MILKDRIDQIIKLFEAALAAIALRLTIVKAPFAHLARATLKATDPFKPAQFTYVSLAFSIIDELLDIEHRSLFSFIVWCASAYGFSSPFTN
jgi:hypothetical protein